jgi:endogenous inhibitor of DNA gyrase (YacG/DUF329 family)
VIQSTRARLLSCPRCGARATWSPENRYRPFCSERCKLIDLGDWATEKFRVPVEEDKDPPEAGEQDEGSGIRD